MMRGRGRPTPLDQLDGAGQVVGRGLDGQLGGAGSGSVMSLSGLIMSLLRQRLYPSPASVSEPACRGMD
jgi:hypothetical protein